MDPSLSVVSGKHDSRNILVNHPTGNLRKEPLVIRMGSPINILTWHVSRLSNVSNVWHVFDLSQVGIPSLATEHVEQGRKSEHKGGREPQ